MTFGFYKLRVGNSARPGGFEYYAADGAGTAKTYAISEGYVPLGDAARVEARDVPFIPDKENTIAIVRRARGPKGLHHFVRHLC